jgi:hypothetical protein
VRIKNCFLCTYRVELPDCKNVYKEANLVAENYGVGLIGGGCFSLSATLFTKAGKIADVFMFVF